MDAEWIRRLVDTFVALSGLALLSPVLLGVALLIRLDSPGPIFYRATRVGKDGQIFILFKFRSMIADADKLGPMVTSGADTRITKVGHKLRSTKLDELPQLINVLKGEMSLVGPRPEDPSNVAYYSSDQRQILKVRPGITSPASLVYRNEEQLLSGSDWETKYLIEVMPAKLNIDLDYLSRRTLKSDFQIVLLTVKTMFERNEK